MLFGKIQGIALVVLGAMLLGVQLMLYMSRKDVRNPPPGSSIQQVEHKTNPLPGIIGIVSLVAGVAIFVTVRRQI